MVIICSPNLIECTFMILALSRIGVVHYVVRDYFRSQNLANNITDLKPKIIVCSSTFIKEGGKLHAPSELIHKALEFVQ